MPSTLSPRSLLLLLACAPWLSLAQDYQACWYPDGSTQAPDVPCNNNGTVSACCNNEAFCLENGLCLRDGTVSRGSCTDKNWGPECPEYCSDGSSAPCNFSFTAS